MSQKVFVIHGWSYNLDKWQNIVPILKKQGIEAVLLKVPGLTTPSKKVWNIDEYVEWLKGELKGEKKPTVIGHSNGGRIAMTYLQKYPGSFKQLILIDSAGVAHEELTRKTKLKALKVVSKIGKPLGKVPIVKKGFYKLIGAQDYGKAPENMKATMQNMLAADKLIDPTKITVPTTIIWGENDTMTPLKDGRTLLYGIPHAELHVVEGGRHAPQDTHANQVAELIHDAIKGKHADL